jgi:hypothetical protein
VQIHTSGKTPNVNKASRPQSDLHLQDAFQLISKEDKDKQKQILANRDMTAKHFSPRNITQLP